MPEYTLLGLEAERSRLKAPTPLAPICVNGFELTLYNDSSITVTNTGFDVCGYTNKEYQWIYYFTNTCPLKTPTNNECQWPAPAGGIMLYVEANYGPVGLDQLIATAKLHCIDSDSAVKYIYLHAGKQSAKIYFYAKWCESGICQLGVCEQEWVD